MFFSLQTSGAFLRALRHSFAAVQALSSQFLGKKIFLTNLIHVSLRRIKNFFVAKIKRNVPAACIKAIV